MRIPTNYSPDIIHMTARGERLRLCELTDEHVVNCVLFMRQRIQKGLPGVLEARNELVAALSAEVMMKWVDDLYVYTYEAASRGLKIDLGVAAPNPSLFKNRKARRRAMKEAMAVLRAGRQINM